MSTRFVILHHMQNDGEHWDLMLEHAGILWTWQLEREPTTRDALPMPARRIEDHRLAYLSYEGPISRGRGSVRRIDSGLVEYEDITSQRVAFQLFGERLRGGFAMIRSRADSWALVALESGV